MKFFDENCVTLRMASFCFQIVIWGSFDRFLSIFFKKNKNFRKNHDFCTSSWRQGVCCYWEIHQIYQNSRFYMIRLTFYDHYKSLQTLLFYSKQKVWIFPEILSPFPAPYDKISLLSLLADFSKKWDFGEISCILMHLDENVIFSQNLNLN